LRPLGRDPIVWAAGNQEADMGLSDILTGMQHGPRGAPKPSSGGSGGGMSPLTMALLGLLAYKAIKSFGGGHTATAPSAGAPPTGGTTTAANPGGGLGDLLGGLFGGKPASAPAGGKPGGGLADLVPGGLGGVFGGAAAGTVLSGGLDQLIKGFRDSGHGKVAQSWVSTGPNDEIAPSALADALGSDTIDALTKQTGMGREELLAGLSKQLPQLVDQLTPKGRLPTEGEASQLV
jgi:uncharacterized protein YidB (DUF937 family)